MMIDVIYIAHTIDGVERVWVHVQRLLIHLFRLCELLVRRVTESPEDELGTSLLVER